MYVADVIPFSPGAPAGSLSYRSTIPFATGSVVHVRLRKRIVPGVVVGCVPVREAKATIKAASFSLSGTISKAVGCVPPALMEAIARTAVWHASSVGSVLFQLLGPWTVGSDLRALPSAPASGFDVLPLESPLQERRARYRAFVDEEQAHGRATLLVVSTLAEVAYWRHALADFSPIVLSGVLKDARREALLEEARASRALVIATPHFSFAQIEALGRVIVERIGAGGFRLPKRPYLDMRIALLELARSRKLRVVFGDYPLPLEYRSGARKLAGKPSPVEVVDARSEREEGESWSAVPKALRARIADEIGTGGRVAVFAVRKGYSPVVLCRDCGQALKDERGKVYAFAAERGKREFRTADGKSELSTSITCPNCGSWNLLPLGVGVERVYEELRAAFPDASCLLFNADSIHTGIGAARKLAPLKDLGSIVVGTEAMAPWLLAASPAPISLAAVASADSLLALPFWRARERFLRLGYLLASLAPRAVVATRLPDDAAVRTLADPRDPAFFDEEEALRRALGYPPFGTLISLTWQGSQAILDSLESSVRVAIGGSEARAIPDRSIGGKTLQRTLVLTLPKDTWPDDALSTRLATLPPSVRVLVDPESF